MKKRAVFLDRDGTINEDVGYPSDYSQINIYPYSFEAVRKINRAGFLAVVITNQSGIGRGFLTEANLQDIHDKMNASFTKENARLDAFYYCPHYARSSLARYRKDCSCRKPNPDMALRAAADFDIDLADSYMIGDKVEDIVFGWNIKARPILVLTGFGNRSLPKLQKQCSEPVYVAQNLLDAVRWIVEKKK